MDELTPQKQTLGKTLKNAGGSIFNRTLGRLFGAGLEPGAEKDAGRLKRGGFLRDYEPGAEMVPSDQGAYILEVAIQEGGMSATDFRTAMKNESLNDNQKMMVFREFFGSIEPNMFNFIKDKLNVGTS